MSYLAKKQFFINERFLAGLLLTSFLFGCTSKNRKGSYDFCQNLKSPCLHGKALVEIRTNRGVINFELDGDSSPVTAGNFVDLVNKGFYDNTFFYRVIKKPIPFVVAGGRPYLKSSDMDSSNFENNSFIDPSSGHARFVPLEMKLKGESIPRYGQLITNPNELLLLELRHKRGSLSMLRSMAADSASTQFFISLRPLPELDGRYSVFGNVVSGMDVVEKLVKGDAIIKSVILPYKSK